MKMIQQNGKDASNQLVVVDTLSVMASPTPAVCPAF